MSATASTDQTESKVTASTTPSGGLFLEKFADLTDYTGVVKATEQILQKDFDPKNIKSLASKIGSIYQTGQMLRNKFASGITPTDIMGLAQNGLTKEVSKLASENGLSSLLTSLGTWTKTKYSYKESEKRIDGKNLKLNYNPINIFPSLIEQMLRNRSDDDSKAIEDFYTTLNAARRKIFEANTTLYTTISSILEIHELHNLTQYSTGLESIFSSDLVYDEAFSIQTQLLAAIEIIHDYIAKGPSLTKFIKNKDRYLSYLETLGVIMTSFNVIVSTKELRYAFESLKTLRRVDDTTVFTPL